MVLVTTVAETTIFDGIDPETEKEAQEGKKKVGVSHVGTTQLLLPWLIKFCWYT